MMLLLLYSKYKKFLYLSLVYKYKKVSEEKGSMSRKGIITLNKIHRTLLEESDEKRLMRKSDIKRIIKVEAGFSNKTVSKYWKELKDFGKIKKESEGIYKVKEIEVETPEVNNQKKKSLVARIDEELCDKATALGFPKDKVITNAIIEWMDKRKEFLIKKGFNVDEKESEVMIQYLQQEIYKENFKDDKEKKRIHRMRREIYLDVMDKDRMEKDKKEGRDDFNHLSDLRKKSFRLAEHLGYVEKPAKSL